MSVQTFQHLSSTHTLQSPHGSARVPDNYASALDRVPVKLWSTGPDDIGRLEVPPILVQLIQGAIKKKTEKGEPDKYRMVQDLRAVNDVTILETPIVPNPHTLLSQVPPSAKFFTVVDLANAFFSVPLHPSCQYLFAFTHDRQQYTWTVMPQGAKNSPSQFARAMAYILEPWQKSHKDVVLLQYVDDLLLCADDLTTAEHASEDFLCFLAPLGCYNSRGSRFCCNMNYFVYFFLLLGLIKAQQVAITKDNHVYTFWYNSSSTRVATFTFDYCYVVNCTFPWSLSSTVYKDIPNMKDPYICVTDDYWGYECSSWKAAGWNTGPAWGYRPQSALDRLDENGESLLKRMTFRKPGGVTPIRLALNIEHPSPGDAGQYVMGMYWKGGGSYSKQGTFYLRDMYDSPEWVDAAHMTINPLKPHIKTLRDMIAIANPTYEDTMAVETGFFDTNLWLDWMRYNANKHNRSNCYVCGGARPHLGTVPLNIPPEIEMCFLSLYTAIKTDRTECESWTKEYPIILKNVKPDKGITIYPGNYTCYGIYDGVGQFFGNFTGKYCATYSPIPAALIQQHVRSLGDIYWICGDMQIRTRLEAHLLETRSHRSTSTKCTAPSSRSSRSRNSILNDKLIEARADAEAKKVQSSFVRKQAEEEAQIKILQMEGEKAASLARLKSSNKQ
ncbi:uncharacterized protein RCH25_043648 [Pelodytes ibericus]